MDSNLRVLKQRSSSSDGKTTDAVIFVGISLVLGMASRHLLRGTRVPYTVALLLLGIGLGALEHGTNHGLGRIGHGIRIWSSIDPDLLLAVFLPALLFESSFSMEIHQIKRCIMQMFLLAGPGVLISTFFLGASVKLAFPYNWNWKTSLLLGGLLSATDPVAVVALLKELGASKKLSTIIEGESLMNDGTAIVVYQLFLRMVLGWTFNWGAVVKFLAQVSLGAVGIGLAFGVASIFCLGYIFNDTVVEITLTLAVSYIAYFTSQEGLDVSGVLTVMTLGMFYSAFGRTAFKGESQQSLHHFWEMVAYIANTLIFILSGVVISESIFRSGNILAVHENSWGYLFLLYVFVQLSRVVVVGALFPLLQYFGYGLDWKEAIILVWSGLRGAVALSLSLSVQRSNGMSVYISSDTGYLFVFLTGGIVFLTLIINGSTTQVVLHMLNMDKLSPAKNRIMRYTKYEMLNKALQAFGDLGDDEELGPADWPTVKHYIKSLNDVDVDGDPTHPHIPSENDVDLEHLNLEDVRVRLLNGVQAAYWVMLEEGRITQPMANILMRSVDDALDQASDSLRDWEGLNSYVSIPNHYRFLQSGSVPQRLITYLTVERLESACYICAAFLRAHTIARQQLLDFLGDSTVTNSVIGESEQEGEKPRKFLEDVRITFPQVLRVVKTRQVTYSVLNHLIDYVNNLEKIGLLDEKEMSHLHDAVQTDLKMLLRNPPMVKVPKARDLIAANPLLGALPSSVRKSLVGSTKELMKLSGTKFYREGSKPSGIWLISNGVVKWSSKSISHEHLLHPTFSHGSTLGLYEVLTGKPYLCDITADSVVLCFFVEAEKILAAWKSDPAVEEFFWQESVIVLAKLMLPHIFEKMTMQELRSLIAERSTMKTYVRGETFELAPHHVGFLLEGYIKMHGGLEELLTAPAAVFPSFNQSFLLSGPSGTREGSFIHRLSLYHVEARSRIITYNLSGFDTGRSLQKKKSSMFPELGDRPVASSVRRDHSALMSWPRPAQRSKQDFEVGDHNENNLSARALQLSVYGSMGKQARSFSVRPGNLSHTQSNPEVIPSHTRPVVSVKSEGAATFRRSSAAHIHGGLRHLDEDNNTTRDDLNDNSSDHSGDHIVQIDSPSRLSFQQAS